jgi:glycosyltransferase involved in cell wall biosynthesis
VVKEAGHELFVLTLTERGPLHEALEEMGIKTYSCEFARKPSWKYFLHHIRHLVGFCKQHNIDAVWSHLQSANIIALLAQPLLKAKVIVFRHHAESAFYAEFGEQFGMQRNKNEVRFDKLTNRLAKKIVIPSSGVWYGMEKYEGCDMSKVLLVPYIYDFSTYQQPDLEKVKALRKEYSCGLLLIMVSRMIASKQHMPVFEVIKKLVDDGLSVKMIVMDDGPLRPQLVEFMAANNLNDHFFLTGFCEDFVNYMAAADMLIHPSVTEASNNVVKEMGLLNKSVAVCEHVGDFDDYITDRVNGYILNPSALKDSIETVIRDAYSRKDELGVMGAKLNQSVFQLFSDRPENRERFLKLI